MNEIITVDFDKQTVSARELYNCIGSSERFTNWFERQLQYGFVENEDYVGCKTFNTLARQELQDYELSVDMAKQICMVQKNEKARAVRQYLIDLEKAWNTPEMVFARALKMADRTIESLRDANRLLEQKIEEDAPKTLFADSVTNSDSTILIRDLAKLITQNGYNIGEKRLYQWMRENGFILKNSTYPSQRAMEQGLFVVMERTILKGDGKSDVKATTRVTGKGQVYFINKFLNEDKPAAHSM